MMSDADAIAFLVFLVSFTVSVCLPIAFCCSQLAQALYPHRNGHVVDEKITDDRIFYRC